MKTFLLLLLVTAPACPAAAAGRCRASFTVEKALKEKPADPALFWALGRYVVYKAFASRKPALCFQLKPFQFMAGIDDAMMPGDVWCRGEYAKMVFAREYNAPTPDFDRACRRFLEALPGKEAKSSKEVALACGVIAHDRTRPAALCEELAKKLNMRGELSDCRCTFGSLAGHTDSCAPHVERTPRHVGPRDEDSYAALSAASRAKDPGRCGEALMCRQVMGVDVSGVFAAQAEDVACGKR
ncbi:MAG: hypothetical protein KGJ84_08470 [Elusimicrobia bacterium]|nr:hypothetical protein [Elusimicrobiota bacterium]